MKYKSCRKLELAKFATDRGLQVANTASQRSKGPLARDYVAALQQADKDATFRFMDLPPELRNMVYDELLTLKNSWKCHPQIVCTNRIVQSETTNLLYGNNLLEIKIQASGVFAHGVQCGAYIPNSDKHRHAALIWPSFLHKAHFLRISMPNESWSRSRMQFPLGSRIPMLANVFYSLAGFLESNNRLRSVEVALELYPHLQGDKSSVIPLLETACYPLRLLGAKPIVNIRDPTINGLDLLDIKAIPAAPIHHMDWSSKARYLKECIMMSGQLATQDLTSTSFQTPLMFLAALMTSNPASSELIFGGGHDSPPWLRAVAGALNELRDSMQHSLVDVLARHGSGPAILQQVNKLLRLEIDLRVAAQG